MQNISRREKEKESRKAEIVEAAQKVFCAKGFDNASMDEIAREAQFAKRTIYQYFVSKDDLLFAVAVKGFRTQFEYLEGAISQGGTGLEQLRRAASAYHRFCRDFPGLFRLMSYAGHVPNQSEAAPSRQELIGMGQPMFREFAAVVQAGKEDGSIRGDVDPLMGACSVAFVLTGFFRMLAEAGESFTTARGLDQDEFVEFTLRLLGDALGPR